MHCSSPFATLRREARQCRVCGGRSPDVRFGPLAGRLCLSCKAERDARRVAREVTAAPRRPANDNRSPAHLAWVRTHRCATGRPECPRPVDAHHVRLGTDGGTGLKPSDRFAVPLCHPHHLELHQVGARTFERRYGVDLRALAGRLANLSPHLTPEPSHAP